MPQKGSKSIRHVDGEVANLLRTCLDLVWGNYGETGVMDFVPKPWLDIVESSALSYIALEHSRLVRWDFSRDELLSIASTIRPSNASRRTISTSTLVPTLYGISLSYKRLVAAHVHRVHQVL